MDDIPVFTNKDEEIEFWKNKANSLYQELQIQKQDAEEFEAESRQLEKEYDITISQNEKTIKELKIAFSKAQLELESLKTKFETIHKENCCLEEQVTDLNNQKADLNRYVRELEQRNDDLERGRRIVEESIQGFQEALNSAIERNAILESEVDEKETLKEKMQRLVDETRDLKQELTVKEKERLVTDDKVTKPKHPVIDSNKLRETETQTTPIKRDQKYMTSLSPASRVMALNVVGDLIRKIGALERGLETSRYEYMDTHRRNPSTQAKNSPTPSIQSLSK